MRRQGPNGIAADGKLIKSTSLVRAFRSESAVGMDQSIFEKAIMFWN
jgi:hypothetical protein